MHVKMKYEIEKKNITTFFPDLVKKRGKYDLTIGIHQQPNEADIIIRNTPIIERHIRKKAAWQTASNNYQYKVYIVYIFPYTYSQNITIYQIVAIYNIQLHVSTL